MLCRQQCYCQHMCVYYFIVSHNRQQSQSHVYVLSCCGSTTKTPGGAGGGEEEGWNEKGQELHTENFLCFERRLCPSGFDAVCMSHSSQKGWDLILEHQKSVTVSTYFIIVTFNNPKTEIRHYWSTIDYLYLYACVIFASLSLCWGQPPFKLDWGCGNCGLQSVPGHPAVLQSWPEEEEEKEEVISLKKIPKTKIEKWKEINIVISYLQPLCSNMKSEPCVHTSWADCTWPDAPIGRERPSLSVGIHSSWWLIGFRLIGYLMSLFGYVWLLSVSVYVCWFLLYYSVIDCVCLFLM